MNPFAAVNDGLVDITWIDDPRWQGTFGVTGLISDARSKGIQAYKGHSRYMRGRKIKINYTEPQHVPTELELTPDGETPDGVPVEQTLNRPFVEPDK